MPPDKAPARDEDRTWAVLSALHRDVPSAVLIGGWATWLRTRGPMSHDIDLIVSHAELAQVTVLADDVSESRHFAGRKWRGSINDVHLDLYVPHQSRLGARLKIRVEHLLSHVETIEGWRVLSRPAHFVTKLAALLDRPDSLPGQKDRRELLALLKTGIDQEAVIGILRKASELAETDLPSLIQEAFSYLAEDLDSKEARRHLKAVASSWVRTAQR